MASQHLPIPAPPRTPTPPTPIPTDDHGSSLDFDPLAIYGRPRSLVSDPYSYDPSSLSPSFGSLSHPMQSNNDPDAFTPAANGSSDGTATPKNPFNFQPQTYTASPPVAKSNIGQRRGHRYKHSSVGTQHQIFLEPPVRAPLALPASLPIPTIKEAWHSMSKEQTRRIAWCGIHGLVAAYVLYSAEGSLALTALSHLIFFDAVSATICVAVDVLCNFEVWKRSSIRHPFGLERAEVLAGFAMSIFLLFMSFDLLSHNLKHILESVGSHQPHHPHVHVRVSPGSVDSAALAAIIVTLVSAIGLKNHARIAKAMRFAPIWSSLPSILSNPSHFLTLSCSTLMLVLPLLSISHYIWLDRLLCAVIAISMFMLGARLAVAQGRMLLMSFNGDVELIIQEIERESSVVQVEEARFWRIHYGLCMANLKIRIRHDESSAAGYGAGTGGAVDVGAKLREKIGGLIRSKLGGGYGKGSGVKWEITTQLTSDS